ncbi:MAG: dihydroxyacetone kinase subunit DhaL [Selenomonadaceae bacterium]
MDGLDLAALQKWIKNCAVLMQENKELLIALDSAVGDGDLGLTMTAGFDAARESIQEYSGNDLGKALMAAGMQMAKTVPSTMGTLVGSGFMEAGKCIRGMSILDRAAVISITAAFAEGIAHRGKASEGERTILDAICPAAAMFQKHITAGESLTAAGKNAWEAAQAGVEKTKSMLPVYGRAVYYGEKVLGKPDQGAVTGMFIYEALYKSLLV